MDIQFLGARRPSKVLSIRIGPTSLFVPGSSLYVRVGQEKTYVTIGDTNAFDVRIGPYMARDIARVLNQRLLNCRVLHSGRLRRVYLVPKTESYIHASYPHTDAITVETVNMESESPLGDIDFVNGDFRSVEASEAMIQDIIVRCLSSKTKGVGFWLAKDYGSGWDNFVGKSITPELIAKMEAEFFAALNRGVNYRVRGVRLLPIDQNTLQPLIYVGNSVINLPAVLNISEGRIVPR